MLRISWDEKSMKTLAMRKMEKNFIAVIEKEYPRYPYTVYDLWNDSNFRSLTDFVIREYVELIEAIDKARIPVHNINRVSRNELIRKRLTDVLNEIADLSNTLDYLYEGVTQFHDGIK